MNILRRLANIESKLKSTTAKKGFKYFYTFDSQTYYHNNTTLAGAVNSISPTKVDYRDCAKGASGELDPKDQAFTQEQVAELSAQGWNCFVIKWVDMSRSNLEL